MRSWRSAAAVHCVEVADDQRLGRDEAEERAHDVEDVGRGSQPELRFRLAHDAVLSWLIVRQSIINA